MTTTESKEAGLAPGTINSTPTSARNAGGPGTEASGGGARSEPTVGTMEPGSPTRADGTASGQALKRSGGKFDAYTNWRRQQARAGRSGTLRARAMGVGQSQPREKARPERWMSEEEKKREKERSRSAAAFFRESLYGNESGKCDLGSVLQSTPGECGVFCAFCSSSRPCRFALRS